MKILIVDDESLARDRLYRMLGEIHHDDSQLELEQAANGIEAVEKVKQLNPDLVLLDIRMPGMDGIEAARKISELEIPPAIIFTTAYDEYALDAFDSQAIAYLLKPIRKEKLEKALHQASRLNLAQLNHLNHEENQEASYISVKIHGGLRQIDLDDIYYFLAEQKYVTVKYKEGEVIIEDSLKSLEDRFEQGFIRIHRNALVSRNQLKAIRKDQQGRYLTELKDIKDKLEVSRRHVSVIRNFLK